MKSGKRPTKKMLSEQQLLQSHCNKPAATWHRLVPEMGMANAIRQDLSGALTGPSKETHKTGHNSSAGCHSLHGRENFTFWLQR